MNKAITTPVMAAFNEMIQRQIDLRERWEPQLALGLAEIKLEINRQFHRAQQEKCQKTAATTSI